MKGLRKVDGREHTDESVDISPTDLELHSGLVFGATARGAGAAVDPVGPSARDPRAVLEELVAEAMRSGPCAVRFSGGRDSSLVLAVAAHVARREGYELPTAVSVRYAASPDADESAWQDLVVDHLGVPHDVVEVAPGDDDICGPLAVAQLVRCGPFIPPTSGVTLGRISTVCAGRTVFSGQGGDEVLGEARISAYVAHWRRRRRPDRHSAALMTRELLPRPARRVLAARSLRQDHPAPWLNPAARREITAGLVDAMTDEPWDWREARWQTVNSRLWAVGSASLKRVAAVGGFTLSDPLLDPRFVRAMCARGGRTGLATRTEAMRMLAEDLLPLKVLRRGTKAVFDNVYAGDRTRAFARDWDGSGVDTELVDVALLRQAWLADHIPVASLAPLQLALIAAVGRGWQPAVTAPSTS